MNKDLKTEIDRQLHAAAAALEEVRPLVEVVAGAWFEPEKMQALRGQIGDEPIWKTAGLALSYVGLLLSAGDMIRREASEERSG